jgi:type I restriction enzyme S subunit
MSIWPQVPLGKLGAVVTGSTPRTSEARYFGGDIPFVTPGDLDHPNPVMSAPRTLTNEGAEETRLLPEGAVMVCCIGSLGKVGIAGRPLATNQQINSIIFDPNRLLPRFGYYACRRLKPQLEAMAPATTVAIVSKSKFEALTIPVPPLSEQRRIAAILDAADDLRFKRHASLDKLDLVINWIFLDLFGDPSKNTNGWPTAPLASLVRDGDSINYGVIQPGDDFEDGVPLIRVGDLVNGGVSQAALKRIAPAIDANYKRSRLRGDEILVSCVGSIGVVAMADASLSGFNIARAVARIPLAETVSRAYVAAYLNTAFVQRYFTSELRTVSQPTLNIKQLSETVVALPPSDLQHDFGRRVDVVEKLKVTQRTSLTELRALFAALQHQAFLGEV